MTALPETQKQDLTMHGAVVGVCRWLASLKLAVILLVALAGVLAWATLIEASRGLEYAQWYIYYSPWFRAMLGLLAVNVLAATLIRFPWKRRQFGFLVAHAGVLVLLVGSLVSFWGGIEGRLSLAEGETADSILLPYRSQLKVVGHGQDGQLSTEFSFSPGPVDWTADQPLDFGRANGMGLRVLEFYHHGRREVTWRPDDSGLGGPALKLGIGGIDGGPVEEVWCVANPFGAPAAEGGPAFEFQRASVESMAADFLKPPADDLPEKGLLSLHYQGQTYPIAVDDNVGKEIPLGSSGVTVVIVAYHPNAVSEGSGRFTSVGTVPKNPLVQLEVRLPDGKEAITEIAYARNPFVNFDLMRATACPVKFWYHHPAVSAQPGVEFLETPDEKLYCRLGVGGKYQPQGEVKAGDRIEVSPGVEVSILSHLPHARREVAFHPAGTDGQGSDRRLVPKQGRLVPSEDETARLEAAALVELSLEGTTQNVWLRRSDQPGASETIETAQGPLVLSLGYERLPLGFSLKLLDFKRGMNPGRMGDASFASEVQLVDEARQIRDQRKIAMNQPLTHGKFTFYQSSFSELPGGTEMSVLTAAHDPGRLLKYLGSVMISAGIFIMYYLKALFRGKAAPVAAEGKTGKSGAGADGPQSDKGKRSVSRAGVIGALVALLAFCAPASAEGQPGHSFRFFPWQSLPVLDGGRHKPLDTLARETLRRISNRRSFRDPETGKRLSPTAMYLEMLFDWQGWDRPPDPHTVATMGSYGAYFASHQADKWDRADLLRVDGYALREALGMAKGDRYLSPIELGQAEIRDPHTGQKTPFLSWAAERFRGNQDEATSFEKKGLELVDKLLTYQAHRMGKRLFVLPVKGSEHQDWVSIDGLLESNVDEQTGPAGEMRKAEEELRKVRAAYLAGSAEAFDQAATAFLATARETGPQLGPYPGRAVIALELAYNRWAPFWLAWVFTLVAFLFFLLGAVARWKAFFVAGLTALGASLAAMLVGFTVRTVISGRAPVTNLYESVIFMGFGTLVFGLIFGLRSRRQSVLAAAAVVATIALVLADYCPNVLDPGIRPLVPVLRSNIWLAVHVITIMLSYAAFALALAIGNITLGFYLVGSTRQEAIRVRTRFTYKLLQAGVFLLVVGTILGAMWADYSWGRFWGWDRKEVWALITLLGYLGVLHARSAGWIGHRGLAAWSVACFAMVVMAWYGVNLMGPGGLHDYGLGGDAAAYYIFAAIALELLYVVASSLSMTSLSWQSE